MALNTSYATFWAVKNEDMIYIHYQPDLNHVKGGWQKVNEKPRNACNTLDEVFETKNLLIKLVGTMYCFYFRSTYGRFAFVS